MEAGEQFISAEKYALDLEVRSPLRVVDAGMQNQSRDLVLFHVATLWILGGELVVRLLSTSPFPLMDYQATGLHVENLMEI